MTEAPKRGPGRPRKEPDAPLEAVNLDHHRTRLASEPPPIRVIFSRRATMSDRSTEEFEATWPQGWPLPQLNDAVTVNKKSYRVQFATYDLDERAVRIAVQ